MLIEWSGLGPELLVRLDRNGGGPLGAQLEHQLREAIRSRRLAAGERLPSSRKLAEELGVSRGLVQECYAQLLAEGFLSARGGSGTRVAAGAALPAQSPDDPPAARNSPPAARRSPPVVRDFRPVARDSRPAIDFRPGWPDIASFPRSDWLWALREAARSAPDAAFGYGDPRGAAELREVLAAYLRRVRGAVADPERIVVCTGFAQGYNLVLRALARRGVDPFAVEDPGHLDDLATAERWGLSATTIPVDEHGLVVEALTGSGARGVLLTPGHQSPTGVVLAPQRRQEIVAWADAAEGAVIEDDYDSEFRYDREPVGALQGLAPHRVALVGTVSKSLSPGLRLGWVLSPPDLLDLIVAEKDQDDRGSPVLDQLALATLIRSGRFDRHLRRMRSKYAARRQALIEALATHAPRVELSGLAAGIHAVACLPAGADERAIAAAAAERSVGLYPMSRYRSDGSAEPPQLVMGFGDLTEPAIARGIATIADLLA
jgi:GntR family transcriptional regulator / MocR family aminotransferase